ncbi:MAG: hypothetical protein ACFB01_07155 [Cohaesibacteraceae bacterium]
MRRLSNRLARLETANAPALPTLVAGAPLDWTTEEAEVRLSQLVRQQGIKGEYNTLIIPEHGRADSVGIIWFGGVDEFFADIAANSSRLGCEPRNPSSEKPTTNTGAVL